MDGILKIIELLNKPLHFLVVGLFILIWGIWVQPSLDYLFLGSVSVLISCCSFIETGIKKQKIKKEANLQEIKKNEEKERKKQRIIKKYESMSKDDRYVIDYCLAHKYQVFKDDYSNSNRSMLSLYSQGWGICHDSVFTMNTEHFNILLEYKKNKQTIKRSSNKKRGE